MLYAMSLQTLICLSLFLKLGINKTEAFRNADKAFLRDSLIEEHLLGK